ncbi:MULTISPECIES: protein translocase subunit SecDF [unclassified Aureimonas]|uniref:protein translocase subunit SecDF n=1 Tax=unclassified Aureimonas TaxID=2615206 RepID=UPI00070204F3|nr:MULTISPECIES: protein translocase subunit SecDF [unclassified Aureimonas]KQT60519.1 preprotein translocase subunit SecD [Aureimonas sp. Leaf427]KQT79396.1 preprotein translocase subunit SecD [Aureimonas sp. Leaf460]
MLHFARWKTILIWLAVVVGFLFAAPNVIPQKYLDQMPGFMPKQPMTLGLDLQGGSYILLQVDRQSLVNARLQSVRADARQALRTARIGFTGLGDTGSVIDVTIRDPAQLAAARTALQPLAQSVSSNLLSGTSVNEVTISEPRPGTLRLTLTDAGIEYRLSSASQQSVEVVRRRVDELGTTEPLIQRQGSDRIMVQVPGLQDPQRLKALLDQTAQLTFRLVDTTASAEEAVRGGRPPAGTELLYTNDQPPRPVLVQREVMISGENLNGASAGFQSQNNQPVVNISFDARGAQRFGQVTQQNVGKPFAIVLDNVVLSAPNINEPILGGQAQISGNFTVESANDLAVLLRAGALPATLDIIEERTVGPGLGADSVAAGQLAGVIGAILVVGFMFATYGFLGLLANIALLVNVVLMIALLSVLGSTLTLPGIAGIVLTMGMAVDSNVLIYERIREERRLGQTVVKSLDAGFHKALATIMDANVTTLIAAAALFLLGSGPVKGFAVTLAIGILTTIFTALTLTRWMVAFWYKRRRPKEVPHGFVRLVPDGTTFGFMRIRRIAFGTTAALSLLAIVGVAGFGLNLGIDFTGGTVIELKSKGEAADVGALREELQPLLEGEVQVQEFGSPQDALVRFAAQPGGELAQQEALNKVRTQLQDQYDFQRTEVVGPTVSNELAYAAAFGLLGSMALIFLYIWFRFEWQFALAAIVATLHDVIMAVGFLVVTRVEFNLSTIAALLTIVGYSLNDTVVVFDRIRENLRKYKKMPLTDLINLSINETLGRTILTAATTVLAMFALFLFGGDVIRTFVAPMLFGILVGIYSSIFVAGPILVYFNLRAALDKPVAGKAAGTATAVSPKA